MRWIQSLLRTLGNDGAIRNVRADIDRRAALVAHLETLAVRLALVDSNSVPPVSAEAA
jgi:hypothetical protein